MPWREQPSPYWVLASEIMLQQTQVERVRPKFDAFVTQFPDVTALARAPLSTVLTAWSGLGYNRRAKFLWQAAQQIVAEHGGNIPETFEALVSLPGIGPNTAGAVLAYAFEQPVVFIETNIRTVLFHHFFETQPEQVTDQELRHIAAQVLDHQQPREWYWALMDYGTFLKQTAGGRLSQSKHYKKQTTFKGSMREMRGRILKQLIAGQLTEVKLMSAVRADERFQPALAALLQEGIVTRASGGKLGLTDAPPALHNTSNVT